MSCCARKKPHYSEGEAESVAKSMRARYPVSCSTLHAYKCPDCLLWHTGRDPDDCWRQLLA